MVISQWSIWNMYLISFFTMVFYFRKGSHFYLFSNEWEKIKKIEILLITFSCFICYRIASFFRSIMQSYEKTSEIQKKRHFLFISECIVTSVKPKLRKKVEYINAFWKINAIRPEIKAKRGRTWKFKNRDNAKLGGLVKELGCQIVTSFSHLLHLCDEAIEARQ